MEQADKLSFCLFHKILLLSELLLPTKKLFQLMQLKDFLSQKTKLTIKHSKLIELKKNTKAVYFFVSASLFLKPNTRKFPLKCKELSMQDQTASLEEKKRVYSKTNTIQLLLKK